MAPEKVLFGGCCAPAHADKNCCCTLHNIKSQWTPSYSTARDQRISTLSSSQPTPSELKIRRLLKAPPTLSISLLLLARDERPSVCDGIHLTRGDRLGEPTFNLCLVLLFHTTPHDVKPPRSELRVRAFPCFCRRLKSYLCIFQLRESTSPVINRVSVP